MSGSESIRHCGHCRKNVYNLSVMSEAEVEGLIARAEDTCIRYYYRADGTILSSNCAETGHRAPSKLAIGVVASFATATAFTGITALVDVAQESSELSAKSGFDGVRVAMGMMKIPRRSEAPDEVEPDEVEPDEVEPDEVEPDEVEPDEVEPDEVEPDELASDALAQDDRLDVPVGLGLEASPATAPSKSEWPLVPGFAALLSVLALVSLRLSASRRRLQELDAWSVPQLITVAGGFAALGTSSLLATIFGGVAFGAGLAASYLIRRHR